MPTEVEEQYELSTSAMQALSRDFKATMNELAQDPLLDKFRQEFEKLYRAQKKSHQNEKRLMKKSLELEQANFAEGQKIHAALKQQSDDQEMIFQLKREIEKTYLTVDDIERKEKERKEKLENLSNDRVILEKLLETGVEFTPEQALYIKRLKDEKDQLLKTHHNQQNHITSLLTDIQHYSEKLESMIKEKDQKEKKIQNLKRDIQKKKNFVENCKNNRVKSEESLMQVKQMLDTATQEWKKAKSTIKQHKADIKGLQSQLQEATMQSEKTEENVQQSNQKLVKIVADYKNQIEENKVLTQKEIELEEEIGTLEKEINRVTSQKETQIEKVTKLKEALKQLHEVHHQKEDERLTINAEIADLKREIQGLKRQSDALRVKKEDLAHQEGILKKNQAKSGQAVEKQNSILVINNGKKRNIERLAMNYQEFAEKQRKEIYSIKKQTDAYLEAKNEAHRKYDRAAEELTIKKETTESLKKKIEIEEQKRKKTQQLFEVTENERNVYSKKQVDTKYQIDMLKNKFENMNQGISTLKEENNSTDKKLDKKKREVKDSVEDKERLDLRKKALAEKIEAKKKQQHQNAREIEKLNQIIQEAEKEKHQQSKELEAVVNDRDILGAQLIKRNDELGNLYEKIKIQQSLLNKGAVQYRDTMSDISMLKLKIDELSKKKSELKPQIETIPVLTTKVNKLQKELLKEKVKIRTLSEELQHPMNVHIWRQIEGSDPQKHDLIMGLQTLQKRLIAKNEEIMQKDILIQQKEKLYTELKVLLQKQPGPEAAEQLRVYQHTLKKKTNQYKHMKRELKMYIKKVKKQRQESESLVNTLADIRQEYFRKLKKEQNQVTVDDLENFDYHESPKDINELMQGTADLERQYSEHLINQ